MPFGIDVASQTTIFSTGNIPIRIFDMSSILERCFTFVVIILSRSSGPGGRLLHTGTHYILLSRTYSLWIWTFLLHQLFYLKECCEGRQGNFKISQLITFFATIIWLKFYRYGVKLIQSINQAKYLERCRSNLQSEKACVFKKMWK